MTFAQRLYDLRLQHGWSQEELAKRIDVSQEFISYLETGVRSPSFATQAALAQAFKLKMSKLMEGVGA